MQSKRRSTRTTVVIPTHNRPASVGRAYNSAAEQAEWVEVVETSHAIADAYGDMDGTDAWWLPHDGPASVIGWYLAASLAGTELVAILFDDDWLEPGYLDAMELLIDVGAWFAFSDALIHFPDGTTKRNIGLDEIPPALLTPSSFMACLKEMPFTISPGCCVFRRETVLEHLHVNGFPGAQRSLVGPDKLLLLAATWEAAKRDATVGHDPRPLVNFSAHSQSTTIRALSTCDDRLRQQYAQATAHFDLVYK